MGALVGPLERADGVGCVPRPVDASAGCGVGGVGGGCGVGGVGGGGGGRRRLQGRGQGCEASCGPTEPLRSTGASRAADREEQRRGAEGGGEEAGGGQPGGGRGSWGG